MKGALITGIARFARSYLVEYLLSERIEVYRTVRRKNKAKNLNHTKDKLKPKEADVRDAHFLELAQPNEIHIEETNPLKPLPSIWFQKFVLIIGGRKYD
jgi:GDP-D-mannose dehydratase